MLVWGRGVITAPPHALSPHAAPSHSPPPHAPPPHAPPPHAPPTHAPPPHAPFLMPHLLIPHLLMPHSSWPTPHAPPPHAPPPHALPTLKSWTYSHNDSSFPPGCESQTLLKAAPYLVCTRDSATVIELCINCVKELTTVYHAPALSQEDGLIGTVNERDLLLRVKTSLKLNRKYDETRFVV